MNVGRCLGSFRHVRDISSYSSGRQSAGISGRVPFGTFRTTSRPERVGYGVHPDKQQRFKLV